MVTLIRLQEEASDGQDTIEYALLIVVLVLSSVIALTGLGAQLTEIWQVAAAWINGPLP
ncbi:MAG: Flp family type IVb pilin [Anaerolineae bacterium]|jgi:Flp pilus assembly pilin Flp